MKLDARSERKLKGVHPDLVKVVRRAAELTPLDFTVTCGTRTLAEQKILVAKGASKTLKSRHIPGGPLKVSHAVDLAPMINGALKWDWPLFHKLTPVMKQAAKEVSVTVEWGGEIWPHFKDGPHWQLPWAKYP